MAEGTPENGGENENDTSDAERWRCIFEPRVREWAKGRGVISLLASLELNFPHTFGLVVPEDKDEPRPWVVSADDTSERAVGLAFRRASRHLHPDRLSQRDVSVRVEAEEVLKVLGAAFDDVATWHSDGKTSTPVTATTSNSATECGGARGASTSCANGGTDLRDGIFNDDMAPVRSSSDTAHSTATVQAQEVAAKVAAASSSGAAGGVHLRDAFFGDFAAPTRPADENLPSPTAAPPAAAPEKRMGFFSRGKKKDKSKGSVTAMKAKSKAKENQDNPFGPGPVSVGGKSSLGPGAASTPFDEPPGAASSSRVSNDSLSAVDALFGSAAGGARGSSRGSAEVGTTAADAAAALFESQPAAVPDVSDLFPSAKPRTPR